MSHKRVEERLRQVYASHTIGIIVKNSISILLSFKIYQVIIKLAFFYFFLYPLPFSLPINLKVVSSLYIVQFLQDSVPSTSLRKRFNSWGGKLAQACVPMAQNVPPIQITVNFKNVRSYPKNVGQKMLIYAKIFFKRYWRTVAGRRLICKSIVGKISPKLREKLSRKLRMLIREIGSYYHCNCQSRADERSEIQLTGRWYGIKGCHCNLKKLINWQGCRIWMSKHQEPGCDRSGAGECHPWCLSTIVGDRPANQALKKDKQARVRGTRERPGG